MSRCSGRLEMQNALVESARWCFGRRAKDSLGTSYGEGMRCDRLISAKLRDGERGTHSGHVAGHWLYVCESFISPSHLSISFSVYD